MQTVKLNAYYFPFVSLLATLALAIVLGYGGHLYLDSAIELTTLFAFMLYLNNFFEPIQQLSQLYNTFLSAAAALDKIIAVLDEEPDVSDHDGAQPLAHIEGRVRFEDVHFAYGLRGGETGEEVLHGIDLDVPAGTTVALVGHTGAGKSTIAKLLARFYEPTSGRITIDGVDLNDVTQESLRRQLGIVPQEGFLFAGTVAENIAFGRPDAKPDEIVRAAQMVGAHELILRLEDGYETQLGERGSRLSLGQRQLIAFARALLADPRILILDEATSSVDIGTERTIEQALRTLLADRTSFVIAHRLSTIRDADLIVVLEHGQVQEQGSHEELLARQGSTRASTATGPPRSAGSTPSSRSAAATSGGSRGGGSPRTAGSDRPASRHEEPEQPARRGGVARRLQRDPVGLRLHVPRDEVLQRQRRRAEGRRTRGWRAARPRALPSRRAAAPRG